MKKNNSIKEIVKLIVSAKNPLFICHENPDSDTYGAGFGLRSGMNRDDCDIACASTIEWPYTELNIEGTVSDVTNKSNDLYVFLDCGDRMMSGNLVSDNLKDGIPIINIDHHQSNLYYGDYNYVMERSSTCEIVFDMLMVHTSSISKETADYLYMGIVGDTGLFVHGYTTAATHNTAARLIEFGAEFDRISKLLFRTVSQKTALLTGKVYNNLDIIDNKMAFSYLSLKDFEDCGAKMSDSLGLMSHLTNIDKMQISMLLKQSDESTYKASFRSTKEYDISKLAVANGGGGHKQAAGCKFTGEIQDIKKQILEQIDQLGII